MKILDSIRNKLAMNLGYKFDVNDEVKVKGMEYQGIILDRTFPFSKDIWNFIPGKYYTVMIQDQDYFEVNGKKMKLNLVKVAYREGNLEKLID